MKLVRIMAIAALAAGVSTAAQAGGYSFQSIGGNFGNWAYGDAAANGDAIVDTGTSGYTETQSFAETKTETSGDRDGKRRNKRRRRDGGEKATSSSSAGNFAEFSVENGSGSAQSHSGAVAGSGVGDGFGFKIGNFEPNGNDFDPKPKD